MIHVPTLRVCATCQCYQPLPNNNPVKDGPSDNKDGSCTRLDHVKSSVPGSPYTRYDDCCEHYEVKSRLTVRFRRWLISAIGKEKGWRVTNG